MIIGHALDKVFSNMTIATKDVKYTYGNKESLDNFIWNSNDRDTNAFPMIFYVTGEVKTLNGYKYCNTDLVIMSLSNKSNLSNARTEDSFIRYIEPIYNEVVKRLKHNLYIDDMSELKEQYSYVDLPNYGISEGNAKPKDSKVTAFVDARKVKLRLRIKTNCINN